MENNIILCGYPNDSNTEKLISSLDLKEIHTKIIITSDDLGHLKKSECLAASDR